MAAELWGLSGLAASAFLSATLLPGNSEVALSAFLYKWPGWLWPALCVATVANSAGSATSVWLGRRVPAKELSPRVARWFGRFGPATLLLSWAPFIGDALPLAAGWLRLKWAPCLVWITLGKFLRYAAIGLAMHYI
ncbi:DedA family protein [Crenobacter sp. SG2303]|uniref:DedA family protein n=1 Tax=Crenobacter oryzisoli TaxID=3056844 RepID=A0ABT7XKT6_9NEIS|nr:DedA family protein [Crenobacter sp. SG2303]MDN0074399.1 DedA family protein [Crenobacter sp. SG2303]